MIAALIGGVVIPPVRDLHAALARRGHEVRMVSLDHVSVECFADGYWRETLGDCDIVYYRNGLGDAGRAFLGQELAAAGVLFINPVYHLYPLCQDKAYQAIVAKRSGVPIPKTYIGRHLSFQGLQNALGVPFVMKGAEGTRGANVFLIHTEEEQQRYREQLSGDVLFQQHVPNDGDFRVFVVGGSVHGIFKRVPSQGEFRANISQGGTGQRVTDTVLCAELSRMALTMTSALQIDIAGVDIIQSSDDGTLYFLESNTNPDWRGLDATLGTDTAEHIASYLEERVQAATGAPGGAQ